MASKQAKAVRRAAVLARLAERFGVEPADLHAQAKGDPDMALIITLERLADAAEAADAPAEAAPAKAPAGAVGSVTTERITTAPVGRGRRK